MTPNKKLLLKAVALCLVLCMCLPLAACRKGGNDPAGTDPVNGSRELTYTLTVKTQGGAALADLSVYIYENDSLQDLVAVLATDANGSASFTAREASSYVAVLGNVPAGYSVEKSYPITGENTQIVLPVHLVEGDLNTANYELGSMMQDFTFTDMDGNSYKLSELLQSKKAVVLSFWNVGSNMCKMDLTNLQEAYPEYSDSVAVLAMNPLDQDNEEIRAFAQELSLTFPIGACESQWEEAMGILGYPTTVIVDRYGMITLMHIGGFQSAVEYKDVLAFFTAQDYEQTVVEDYTTLLVSEPENDYNNPVDISGQSSFQLTIDPGKIHYVNIHKMTNVWLQVDHKDIFVEYGNKKFTPTDGSVGLIISAPSTFEPAQLGFGNSGEETITVTVTLSNLPGTYANPYTLKIGDFSTKVDAGNNQGVYFMYTAAEDGYFTLQCLSVSPKVDYGFSAMNLTTSLLRNVEEDGQVSEETGNRFITMPLNKGEKLRVTIYALPDDANNYPAASFKMRAGFTAGEVEDVVVVEKIPYAVTVTDENGQPVPQVSVNLVGTGAYAPETEETPEQRQPEGETEGENPPEDETEEEGPSRASVSTNENGVAAVNLPKDIYNGTIIVPTGYKATTTEFTLTPEENFVSLKIDTHIVVMEDYVVRVVDEQGNPIPGVLITIGSSFGTTDADGVVTLNLEKDDYTVVIGAPAGYYAEDVSVEFPEGSNVLGITLKESEGEAEGVEYTVHVVDANGDALQNIVVTFCQNGTPITPVIAATGTAVAVLPVGDYTVTLTSASGASLKFDASQATLTPDKTETTITVSERFDADDIASTWWGYYYTISTGSFWVDLAEIQNYSADYGCYMYVFEPTQSGIYRFSSSEGTVLGYYGAINFPNGPTYSTDNEEGYFEIIVSDNVFDGENQPQLVIGLERTGDVVEATMTVVRTEDAPPEMPRSDYEPTCTIVQTGRINGTKTYVDLTQPITIEKGSDGYYYYNGKKLYVNLSKSAPYVTMSEMIGLVYDPNTESWGNAMTGTGFHGLIYEDGVAVEMKDFTVCMRQYIQASDPNSGLYPLNDDLVFMFQCGGLYMGWWLADNPNYLFETVEGLNPDTAWMFAVCTVD